MHLVLYFPNIFKQTFFREAGNGFLQVLHSRSEQQTMQKDCHSDESVERLV